MSRLSSPRRRRLREALGYLRWCYLPRRMTSVTEVYDLLGTRALTEHGLWLNLGYWREARTLDEACQALAHLVASTAGWSMAPSIMCSCPPTSRRRTRCLDLPGPVPTAHPCEDAWRGGRSTCAPRYVWE